MYVLVHTRNFKIHRKNNDASLNSETDCIDFLSFGIRIMPNTFGIMAYFLIITYGFKI